MFKYETNYCNADGDDINEMKEEARQVSISTIRRRCSKFTYWCRKLGYDKSFPIDNDWHVTYWKSFYRGLQCYYVTHSGIENIWVKNEI